MTITLPNFKEQRGFVKELDTRELKIPTHAAPCPLLNQYFEYQLHCHPRHNQYSKHQFGNTPNHKVPAMSWFSNTHVVRHLEFSISRYPFPSQNLPILLNFSSLDNCSDCDSDGQVTLPCSELWSSSPVSTWYSDLQLWIWRVVDYIRLAIAACTAQFSYLWKTRT